MEPLISVSIPVYNEEKRVVRAIRSMQRQTYANLEIIVVDDHSTDNTAAVVKNIAVEDPRVSYHLYPEPTGEDTTSAPAMPPVITDLGWRTASGSRHRTLTTLHFLTASRCNIGWRKNTERLASR